jgi:hypothetical protein
VYRVYKLANYSFPAGWDEKDINDFILYIETGEEHYKPQQKK